jgi:hypothetical protein
MPANHKASATFAASKDEIFQACLKAAQQCGFNVTASDPEAGQIAATTKMGVRSWGEKIAISVSADGRTDVSSTCRGIQLVDYGKNKQNVNAFLSGLTSLLPSPAPQ